MLTMVKDGCLSFIGYWWHLHWQEMPLHWKRLHPWPYSLRFVTTSSILFTTQMVYKWCFLTMVFLAFLVLTITPYGIADVVLGCPLYYSLKFQFWSNGIWSLRVIYCNEVNHIFLLLGSVWPFKGVNVTCRRGDQDEDAEDHRHQTWLPALHSQKQSLWDEAQEHVGPSLSRLQVKTNLKMATLSFHNVLYIYSILKTTNSCKWCFLTMVFVAHKALTKMPQGITDAAQFSKG